MVESENVEEIVVVTSKDKPVTAKDVRVVDVDSPEGKSIVGKEPRDVLPRAYVVMRKVQQCEIVKEQGRVTAKCGDKRIDLGKVSSEEIVEKTAENAEDCPGCSSAIAVGWAINYIKPLNDLVANRIFEDVTDEKMTPDEAMDKCMMVAQQHGKRDLADTIKGLKEMMHKPMSELEAEASGKA